MPKGGWSTSHALQSEGTLLWAPQKRCSAEHDLALHTPSMSSLRSHRCYLQDWSPESPSLGQPQGPRALCLPQHPRGSSKWQQCGCAPEASLPQQSRASSQLRSPRARAASSGAWFCAAGRSVRPPGSAPGGSSGCFSDSTTTGVSCSLHRHHPAALNLESLSNPFPAPRRRVAVLI